MEEQFNGGFLALPVWGAYIWRGLHMEGLIFGILRHIAWNSFFSRTPSGVSKFDFSDNFDVQEFSAGTQLHELAWQSGKLGRL